MKVELLKEGTTGFKIQAFKSDSYGDPVVDSERGHSYVSIHMTEQAAKKLRDELNMALPVDRPAPEDCGHKLTGPVSTLSEDALAEPVPMRKLAPAERFQGEGRPAALEAIEVPEFHQPTGLTDPFNSAAPQAEEVPVG